MLYQTIQENWKIFLNLIENLPAAQQEQLNTLIKRYVEQNILILNDVLAASIDHLQRLEKADSINDIICMQAKFTNELNQKISLSTQDFLNASLGQLSDYNEWLKAHCDLATD